MDPVTFDVGQVWRSSFSAILLTAQTGSGFLYIVYPPEQTRPMPYHAALDELARWQKSSGAVLCASGVKQVPRGL